VADEEKKDKTENIKDLADDLEATQKKIESGKDETTKPGLFANKMMLLVAGMGTLVVILLIALVAILMFGSDDTAETPATDKAPTEQVEPAAEVEEPVQQQHSQADETTEGSIIPELTEAELAELEKEFSGDSYGDDRGAQMNKIMDELADIELDSAELAAALGEETEVYDPAEKARQDSARIIDWIEEQKALLAKREADLDSQEMELQRLGRSVDQKITRLEQAESSRTGNLARLYDGMDARAVANLMANLDDETVLSILPRMNTKNASAVLSLLPPRRAAKLSKELITITED